VPAPDEPAISEGLLLSLVAGSVDGLGYLLLHVFTAHITGNTVQVAIRLAGAKLEAAAGAGFAVALFVAGVAVGALVRDAAERRGWPSRAVVFAVGALLLAAFAALGSGERGEAPPAGWRFFALTALATLAVGCQNAVGPKVGGRRVRTYITGTMTEFGEAIVEAGTARDRSERATAVARSRRLLGVWVAYLGGGLVSAAAAERWGARSALVPLAGLAIAIAADLGRARGRARASS
jgi:uncharacterized membrane protein YoaK (UPF0700 family)